MVKVTIVRAGNVGTMPALFIAESTVEMRQMIIADNI